MSIGKVRFEGQGHFSNGGAISIVGDVFFQHA